MKKPIKNGMPQDYDKGCSKCDIDNMCCHPIPDEQRNTGCAIFRRPKQPADVDYRIQIAEQMSKQELIDRLCEEHTELLLLREKLIESYFHLPEYNEIQYHVKALNDDQFREYWNELVASQSVKEELKSFTEKEMCLNFGYNA